MKAISQWMLLAIVTGSVCAFGAVEPGAYSFAIIALWIVWLAMQWHDALRGHRPVFPPRWLLLFFSPRPFTDHSAAGSVPAVVIAHASFRLRPGW